MSDPRAPSGRPERPPTGPSRLVIAYGLFGVSVLVTYLLAGFMGWHFGDAERDVLPAGVRSSPGGYRAYHLWHSGYQGGK